MFLWIFAKRNNYLTSRCNSKYFSIIYIKTSLGSFTNLVEEEVINVVGEESPKLALFGLTWTHIHLYLLNESGRSSRDGQTLE